MGKSKTRPGWYTSYTNMMLRCYCPIHQSYRYYGARGIKVCDEWQHNPAAFGKWAVTHGWHKNLCIDRINPKGDYTPENCRWASKIQSNRNRSSCNYYTLEKMTGTVSQWANFAGIKPDTLRHRLAAGWDIKKAIETPVP